MKWHCTSLDREGFAVMDGFLKAGELPDIERLVDASLQGPSDQACRRPHNELTLLRWNSPLVPRLLGSAHRMQRLSEISDADDLRWISGYISIKAAHSPPLWWHQDWWCWDHPLSYQRASAQLAVLCYLTATGVHNGALRVLPGTDQRARTMKASSPEAMGQSPMTLIQTTSR